MAKEEGGGRLLSKMVKFVRNPLKDWSDIEHETGQSLPSAIDANGYSREALKELIERRQRNDFVRRREFDMLRKMRQREAAGARDGSSPSSLQFNSAGRTDGRALTLKKIDEIEEQMSQQWWKGRNAKRDGDADPLAAQHARAYADTEPFKPSQVMDEAPAHAAGPAALVVESALQEAALRFAEGNDAQAEGLLLEAVTEGGPDAADDATWRALLDFYRATGDAEKFALTAQRYTRHLLQPAPEWVPLPAQAAAPHAAHAAGGEAGADGMDWRSPPQLGRAALLEMTQALGRAGSVWSLDWRALRRIEADAVAPLGTLFGHWGDSPVQLRFGGAERLIAVLAEATPITVRETDLAWWNLHLAALRLMHLPDDFELVALNYCITYEASPPAWQEPAGSYAAVELADAPPALVADAAAPGGRAQLGGDLVGDQPQLWPQLDAALAAAGQPAVCCAALVRMDLAAASGLLNWVRDRAAQGRRVELVDVQRLLAALFGMMGVTDHAGVQTSA